MKRIIALLLSLASVLSCCVLLASADNSYPDPESPLYQKSVLFCGDSICEASNDGQGKVTYGGFGWAARIMAWNDMKGINKGKSAASVSNCRGENTIIAQLKAQKGQKYDLIILHGGVNDAWDIAAVGTMTEDFNGPFDNSTFAGGFEETIKYAKDNFPEAQLGYIINFSLPAARYGKLSDMTEYFDMAKSICDKWDVPYLDLYTNDNLNQNHLKTHTNIYLPDLVHPNSAGYDIISPLINDWMETIAVPEETSEAESTVISDTASQAPESESKKIPPYVFSLGAIVLAAIIGGVVIILVKGRKNK